MTLPTFEEFFSALYPYAPLPWQSDLAARVVEAGWPEEIGVPTGLGKTSCIDIAVWAMAVDELATRRLWYVVNRRLLVDAAHERAEYVAAALLRVTDGPVRAIAEALTSRAGLGVDEGGQGRPLYVARLRGGVPLDASAPDPSQPTVLLATVPMFGSRLLLRGYGVSRGMRPIAAAHAGIDATVLLDEAHLSRPLRDLLGPLAECDPGSPSAVLPARRARPRMVSMTATGESGGDRFDLSDEDLAHPVVRQRLSSSKPTAIRAVGARELAKELASEAVDRLSRSGSTCVVFVNTTATAPAVAREVSKAARTAGMDVQVEVLTGRLRSADAEVTRQRLLGPGGVASGWTAERERPLVVVATQTLEVGADVDFEHLVTECAGVRALVQRFGRLNRLGQRNPVASAAILHASDRKEHPVYGEEVDTVWERLVALSAESDDGLIDLSPGSVGRLGRPNDAPPHVPSLLPHHLWEWSKTSASQQPPTPVEPFFAGVEESYATVTVLWRWYLPPTDEVLFPRPSEAEVVELPLHELRLFLDAKSPDAGWVALDSEGRAIRPASGSRTLGPGATIVLSVALGGYAPSTGWDPDVDDVVEDLSVEAGVLPVLADASDVCERLGIDQAASDVLRDLRGAALSPPEDAELLADVASTTATVWARFLEGANEGSPAAAAWVDRWGRPPVPTVVGTSLYLVPPRVDRQRVRVDVRIDAFDDLSHDETSTHLDEHMGSVAAAAERIAEALGLPEDLRRSVMLAGELHDVGKADSRFQRVLGAAPGGPLLAKSTPGISMNTAVRRPTGWPRGGRHEELSGRAVIRWFEEGHGSDGVDRDLVVHLVVSHHGWGRSLVPPVPRDPYASPASIPVRGRPVTVDGDLTITDWGQPARFRRLCERYGTWGLALLESIVRQADHAASAASRERKQDG
jgi:CRISPR-associated endonuclease/helicase Cas3